MKFTTRFRSTLSLSMLVCMFILTVPSLCRAAAGGQAPVVTIQRDENGDTALHRAARNENGDIEELRKLLASYSEEEVNATSRLGTTALHLAALNSNSDVIRVFFDSDKAATTINTTTHDDYTALHSAALNTKSDVIRAFFDSDKVTSTTLNAITKRGSTVLHILSHTWCMHHAHTYASALMFLTFKSDGGHRFTQIDALNMDGLAPSHTALYAHSTGSSHYKALKQEEPNIFSALIGRAIKVKKDDKEAVTIIQTYGADSAEYKALIAQRSEESADQLIEGKEGGAAAPDEDEDDFWHHEYDIRRTVDVNAQITQRSTDI